MPAAAEAAAVLSPGCCPVAVPRARSYEWLAEHPRMAHEQIPDLETLAVELAQLVREERQLSAVRRRLHEQIDNGFPNEVMVRREREVSNRRRALHGRIDTLRLYVTAAAPHPALL